ncbi:histidine phosphatase family protein [Amedibacillus sp. YH-ame6]
MYMYIVRHGETEWNCTGRVQGISNNPINENGIRQAQSVSSFFDGFEFEAVITSPLERTKQTADILCEHASVMFYREDARVIEKNFGICEGMIIEQRHREYPFGHAEGEESYKEVRKRMFQAIRDYAMEYKKDILIVSHGGAIAALLKELDKSYENEFVRMDNLSITIVDENLKLHGVNLNLDEAMKWKISNK